MEMLESPGSWNRQVAVKEVDLQAVPTRFSGLGAILGPGTGNVGRGNTGGAAGLRGIPGVVYRQFPTSMFS